MFGGSNPMALLYSTIVDISIHWSDVIPRYEQCVAMLDSGLATLMHPYILNAGTMCVLL